MSERQGIANLAAVLDLRRQAIRGFGTGLALAVLVFVYFVAVPGAIRSPVYYVALGFVLAVSAGLLATVGFVAVAAYRRAQDVDVSAEFSGGDGGVEER